MLPGGGGAQVAVDKAGNLVFAGVGFHQVGVLAEKAGTFYGRRMTAGKSYIVAGTGTPGFSGDGGPRSGPSSTAPPGWPWTGPAMW